MKLGVKGLFVCPVDETNFLRVKPDSVRSYPRLGIQVHCIHNHTPLNGLPLRVGMVVLRWEWPASFRNNFVTTNLAAVDAGVWRHCSRMMQRIEGSVIVLGQVVRIFILRHWGFSRVSRCGYS